jgi:hypothetical protein
MNWLSIAASLLRDAISSDDSSAQPQENPPPPEDIAGMMHLLNRHRAETQKNFEALVQMLRAQNEQLLHTIQIQRRWNYGLTVALVLVTILAAFAYFAR